MKKCVQCAPATHTPIHTHTKVLLFMEIIKWSFKIRAESHFGNRKTPFGKVSDINFESLLYQVPFPQR